MEENNTTISGREIPDFIKGEMTIIGACLINESVIPKVLSELSPEDFYSSHCRYWFEGMASLYPDKPVNYLSLSDWLKEKGHGAEIAGTEELFELGDRVASVANLMHYVEIVKTKSERRQARRFCLEGAERCITETEIEDVVAFLQSGLLQLLSNGKSKAGPVSFHDGNREAYRELTHQWTEGIDPGVATGFSWIDERTGGMRPGELWIVAARPAMGKTSFALNVGANLALKDKTVIFFSFEMKRPALWGRIISRESMIPFWHIRNAKFTKEEFARVTDTVGDVDSLKFWIEDKNQLTPSGALLFTQRIALEQKTQPALIVADYLQIMKPDPGRHQTREREVASISAAMKGLAMQMDCPVILLSQLNREVAKRADQRPQLSDLRESGAIEQDADVVIGIHRKWPIEQIEENRTHAEIGILKQRNGPIGWCTDIAWDPNTVSFQDKVYREATNNPRSYQEPREPNMEVM